MLVTSKHQCHRYLYFGFYNTHVFNKNEERKNKTKQIKKGKRRELFVKIHVLHS